MIHLWNSHFDRTADRDPAARSARGLPEAPRKCEGVERRKALLSNHAVTHRRRRSGLMRLGVDILAQNAPPSDAPLRRSHLGAGPRFASMRLKLRMASAGSRQGSLVTPGGAPMQPECHGDEPRPAGAAPRSINWRHRLTPLIEPGVGDICFYS